MPDLVEDLANASTWLPYPKLILSLVLISVTLTVLYIVLSIKLIKEEREEKKQKAAEKKEEEQKKEESGEEVQSSDSEKTLRKRKHASCD